MQSKNILKFSRQQKRRRICHFHYQANGVFALIFTSLKRTLYSEKNMNSFNVEYFLAMNIQNLDKNG